MRLTLRARARALRLHRGRPIRRGQSTIETALILPVLLLITLGVLEFGSAFDHFITLEYSSREGSRTGAALSDGAGDSAVCATIDPQIIAAVQRVLTSPGAAIRLSEVSQIRIFKSGVNGQETGPVNVWSYTPDAGPVVDGERLDFSQTSANWGACSRVSGPVPDSIGVSVRYTYRLTTPIVGLLPLGPIVMTDATVMPLSPTDHS